jgi:cystathionine beta-lyase family protein involved in aluminum resistance
MNSKEERMGFSLSSLLPKITRDTAEIVAKQSEITAQNSRKVLAAFTENQIADSDFSPSTGYGYGDQGRKKLDHLYAHIFHTESALVRSQIVSGTHALALAFFAVLRPGDMLVSLTGAPYDTLQKVIRAKGILNGSLDDFGVRYEEVDCMTGDSLNKDLLAQVLRKRPKALFIQRSSGYRWRKSVSIAQMEELIGLCKEMSPESYTIVDNCYGEFTEVLEPTDVGADLVAGSLIKNPGGSLAPSGGYLAGKEALVEAASYRLTAPGIGREVGGNPEGTRLYMQGLFYAPFIVGEALASSVFAARMFSEFNFPVSPEYHDHRSDIVQAIQLGTKERVIAFCHGIQKASPVDSHVTPIPWDIPGYEHPVIMAAGTFVQGASIEMSADAPMREPFNVYLQGGVSRHYSKIGIICALEEIISRGLL